MPMYINICMLSKSSIKRRILITFSNKDLEKLIRKLVYTKSATTESNIKIFSEIFSFTFLVQSNDKNPHFLCYLSFLFLLEIKLFFQAFQITKRSLRKRKKKKKGQTSPILLIAFLIGLYGNQKWDLRQNDERVRK